MFVTSLIYNAFKGRHADLHNEITGDLEAFIKWFDPLFVIVKANLEAQMHRYDKRGEWYIKRDELETINRAYDKLTEQLLERWPTNFLVVENNTEEDIPKNLKLIEERLKDLTTSDKTDIQKEKRPRIEVDRPYEDCSFSMRG
jgi:hypothetical protein